MPLGLAPSRHQGPFQLGILLLIYQLVSQVGVYTLPPATLGLILLQVELFLGYVDLSAVWGGGGDRMALCLQAKAVYERAELQRVFLAPLLHSSDLHLYYNMVSFAYKGRMIEARVGTVRFVFILVVLTALCGGYYVALAFAASGMYYYNRD